uniref:Uncharacterized protein n=1 Tax=Populus alba TaxID=43335 RepID=A0A4U5Q9T6_POPAL|nr:hypothetical protein D5086_0000131820 [Populus alba]
MVKKLQGQDFEEQETTSKVEKLSQQGQQIHLEAQGQEKWTEDMNSNIFAHKWQSTPKALRREEAVGNNNNGRCQLKSFNRLKAIPVLHISPPTILEILMTVDLICTMNYGRRDL